MRALLDTLQEMAGVRKAVKVHGELQASRLRTLQEMTQGTLVHGLRDLKHYRHNSKHWATRYKTAR